MRPLTPSHQPEAEPQKPKLGNLPVMQCLWKLEEELACLGEDEMSFHNFDLFFDTARFLYENAIGVRTAMRQDVSELEDVKERLDAIYHNWFSRRQKLIKNT